MKKTITLLLLCLGLTGLLAGCGDNAEETAVSAPASAAEETSAAPETAAAPDTGETGGGTLVAVFSRVSNADIPEDVDMTSSASLNQTPDGIQGDTKVLAQVAAEATGGDLFGIVVEDKYPADEQAVYDRAKEEQLEQARPALVHHVENMDDYSTIILVYPNWWGSIPMPVCTFLEEYDFSNKTLIPICTYEADADGAGNSRADIQALCDAYVTAGYSVRGNAAGTSGTRTDLINWLNEQPVNY